MRLWRSVTSAISAATKTASIGDEDEDDQQLQDDVTHRWLARRPPGGLVGATRLARLGAAPAARLAQPGRHAQGQHAGRHVPGHDGPGAGSGPSPSSTGATSIVSEPRKTPLPILVLCFLAPS